MALLSIKFHNASLSFFHILHKQNISLPIGDLCYNMTKDGEPNVRISQ